jgi:hypothetical protein
MLLNRIKILLGITDNDELLYEIIKLIEAKILSYLNIEELPKELEYILIELSIERYNRIGSEGLNSESSDGVSFTYNNNDMLDRYKEDLDRYSRNNLKGMTGMRLI